MTLPSSGPLTLSQIQTEFGGTSSTSLSEYYAGGAFVPAGTLGNSGPIPSSGTIKISQFYGASKAFVFTQVFTGGANGPLNVKSAAILAGWDQVVPLNAIITVGQTTGRSLLSSNDATIPAFDTGSTFPGGTILKLVMIGNASYVSGLGGNGGNGADVAGTVFGTPTAGGNGGIGMKVSYPLIIDTTASPSSKIAGGGGGGGGGPGNYYTFNGITHVVSGGGGGGGFPLGLGGAGSTATQGNLPGSSVISVGAGGDARQGPLPSGNYEPGNPNSTTLFEQTPPAPAPPVSLVRITTTAGIGGQPGSPAAPGQPVTQMRAPSPSPPGVFVPEAVDGANGSVGGAGVVGTAIDGISLVTWLGGSTIANTYGPTIN